MSLSVGIVGLPNVGKSTLFNALLAKQQAYVANYPFATIEPNVGIVPVPDRRLAFLAEIIASQNSKSETLNPKQISNSNFQFRHKDSWPPIIPATVRFVDIAGLVKGASQGEGLGNKFLAHIREASVIAHVVRVFSDENVVKEGMIDPKSDFETINTELELADLEMIEKSEKKSRVKTMEKTSEVVLPLLARKPSMIVLNVGEEELKRAGELEREYAKLLGVDEEQVVAICAKVEEELAELNQEERGEYLSSLGVYESGLVRLIKKAYAMLGLMSYLTAGEKEVRAWTIKQGMKAPQAAGVIHTDFEKKFIAAKVCSYADFIEHGGWKGAAEKGKVRTEGKEYEMREGDTVEFMIGS